MKRAIVVLAVCLLASCLTFERVVVTVDLAKQRATFAFRGFGSIEPKPDSERLVSWLASKSPHDQFPIDALMADELLDLDRYSIVSKQLTTHEGRVDGEVVIAYETLHDLAIDHYDAERPARYCPPRGLAIARSNAQYRDDRGCVLWKRGVTLLRYELVPLDRPHEPKSLFDAYKALVKK